MHRLCHKLRCDHSRVQLTLVRHATLIVELAGQRLLVDPMLDPAGARPAVAGTPNQRRNPLVELPPGLDELVGDLDATLVTHLHEDHFDDTAAQRVPRDLPVLCQRADAETLAGHGFEDVRAVTDEQSLGGPLVTRTDGRHGRGEIGESMGPVCGFVLVAAGEPTVYVAGDTIWCPEVEAALEAHRPDVVVVNTGAARFLEGDPITMAAADVVAVCERAAGARVVAVHMDAINHCLLSRSELSDQLAAADVRQRVEIPADGEQITI